MRRLNTIVAAGALALSGAAQAEIFGGVDFPGGVSSFADAVASYAPVISASGQPTPANRDSSQSIGAPNGNSVSLGDGGTIILEFTNNRLTGSGTSALDLWIFEIGPDVEDTFVSISKDGITYVDVGKVFGATSGIDIDLFGFGIADEFRFVRLRDDPDEGDQSGASVGADIDSVGAISSVIRPPVVTPIPEPETWALMLVGLGALGVIARRRKDPSGTDRR